MKATRRRGQLGKADNKEYEVDRIIAVERRPHREIEVLVQWVGHDFDYTYYPISNFKNAREALDDYYQMHPEDPKPQWFRR